MCFSVQKGESVKKMREEVGFGDKKEKNTWVLNRAARDSIGKRRIQVLPFYQDEDFLAPIWLWQYMAFPKDQLW